MISVVISLYNKEKQIAQTLQSVFNQAFLQLEIVIVNDGSTDNSVPEVEKINDKRELFTNRMQAYQPPEIEELSGAMTLGSCAGTLFSMTFDNVISHTQQYFVIPFILIGIFLKAIDLQAQGGDDI